MSSNVNNSISNYIINTATKISKNVSGNNTIITGTINSSGASGYKVSLYGGSDPITAAPLGTEVYNQGDNVYLWMIGSKGGDTHQDFTYYIIGKVNFQVSAEKVFLRESFQSNATGFGFEEGSNSLSDGNVALLKKYSAFKLSLNVNLLTGNEIENFYLRLFFKNSDNDVLGSPLEFSLGDCVGDLLSGSFGSITQEKVFFIGPEYKDFTSVQMETISNGAVFTNINITPGIISTNAQDYSATIKSYSSNDSASVIKDYVLSKEDSVWLKANVLFKTRDLFATGIQYYWQIYNNDKSTWEELNDSESRDILLENSAAINNIKVIKADDNTFELKGEGLTSYRNRVRCVIYYGAIEIISNELIIYNYNKSELKIYKKTGEDSDEDGWIVENNIITDKDDSFKIELVHDLSSIENYNWVIGGSDLKVKIEDGKEKYYIEIKNGEETIEHNIDGVDKSSDKKIEAIYISYSSDLFIDRGRLIIQMGTGTVESENFTLLAENILINNYSVTISSAFIENGNLQVKYNDGTTDDLGKVVGRGITDTSINNDGQLVISYDDNSTPVSAGHVVPSINDDGDWTIGGTSLGKPSRGIPGITPIIGPNGNWTVDGNDTGYPSKGDSAYDTWKGQEGNEGKTEQDFIEDMKGTDGQSAYEAWLAQGNEGTEQDFLEDMKGDPGYDGSNGANGLNGENGENGVGIENITYNPATGRFEFTMSDGSTKYVDMPILAETPPYNITFFANGGYWSSDNSISQLIKTEPTGYLSDFPANPSHNNINDKTVNFGCWTLQPENEDIISKEITTSTLFYSSQAVYAKWTPHIISLDANGGYFEENETITTKTIPLEENDENYTLPDTIRPKHEDYEDYVWKDIITNKEVFKDGATEKICKNRKFIVDWIGKTQNTITFFSNGGYFKAHNNTVPNNAKSRELITNDRQYLEESDINTLYNDILRYELDKDDMVWQYEDTGENIDINRNTKFTTNRNIKANWGVNLNGETSVVIKDFSIYTNGTAFTQLSFNGIVINLESGSAQFFNNQLRLNKGGKISITFENDPSLFETESYLVFILEYGYDSLELEGGDFDSNLSQVEEDITDQIPAYSRFTLSSNDGNLGGKIATLSNTGQKQVRIKEIHLHL